MISKSLFVLVGALFQAIAGFAQVYEIPGAQIQPRWVLPLIFESNDGQRDTIYIAADSSATTMNDSLYGEFPQIIDESVFNVCIGSCGFKRKRFVHPVPEYVVSIAFLNASFPVRVFFDPAVYKSQELPGDGPPTEPRAYGVFGYEGDVEGCIVDPFQTTTNIVLTRTPSITSFGDCFADSVIVLPNWAFASYSTRLVDGSTGWSDPTQNDCNIQENEVVDVAVLDQLGRIVSTGNAKHADVGQFLSNLPSGVYYVQVVKDGLKCTRAYVR